jgi:hypothetical protein
VLGGLLRVESGVVRHWPSIARPSVARLRPTQMMGCRNGVLLRVKRVHYCAPLHLTRGRRLDRRAKFRTQRQSFGPTDDRQECRTGGIEGRQGDRRCSRHFRSPATDPACGRNDRHSQCCGFPGERWRNLRERARFRHRWRTDHQLKIPVTIPPGEIAFTRIPFSPSSVAADRVTARTAPLEAE